MVLVYAAGKHIGYFTPDSIDLADDPLGGNLKAAGIPHTSTPKGPMQHASVSFPSMGAAKQGMNQAKGTFAPNPGLDMAEGEGAWGEGVSKQTNDYLGGRAGEQSNSVFNQVHGRNMLEHGSVESPEDTRLSKALNMGPRYAIKGVSGEPHTFSNERGEEGRQEMLNHPNYHPHLGDEIKAVGPTADLAESPVECAHCQGPSSDFDQHTGTIYSRCKNCGKISGRCADKAEGQKTFPVSESAYKNDKYTDDHIKNLKFSEAAKTRSCPDCGGYLRPRGQEAANTRLTCSECKQSITVPTSQIGQVTLSELHKKKPQKIQLGEKTVRLGGYVPTGPTASMSDKGEEKEKALPPDSGGGIDASEDGGEKLLAHWSSPGGRSWAKLHRRQNEHGVYHTYDGDNSAGVLPKMDSDEAAIDHMQKRVDSGYFNRDADKTRIQRVDNGTSSKNLSERPIQNVRLSDPKYGTCPTCKKPLKLGVQIGTNVRAACDSCKYEKWLPSKEKPKEMAYTDKGDKKRSDQAFKDGSKEKPSNLVKN